MKALKVSLVTALAVVLISHGSADADAPPAFTTIQAAVDAAAPGDTIVVPPGRYHETVTITKSGITIRGTRGAVLDASGFAVGIRAVSGPGGPTCPPATLSDLTIDGLRIEHASFTGVFFRGVDGFAIRNGDYVDNAAYAVFPVCSRDGVIERNAASGSDDAALYVGNSHDVVVQHNFVTDSTAAVEIENSTDIVVRRNTAVGNTAGILAFVLPGLPVPMTDDVLIADNVVARNNRPNPILPDEDIIGRVPTGSGILSLGADRVVITGNVVTGNDSFGIAVGALPVPNPDPRVDPEPDDNRVEGNVIKANGTDPDPLRALTPGADLVYDGTGSGNCFVGNVFGVSIPDAIETVFTCSAP